MSRVPRIFGIPRSGGTLVYNVIRELYDEEVLHQTHGYFDPQDGLKVIIVHRDFRDAAISNWRIYEGEFDEPHLARKAPYSELKAGVQLVIAKSIEKIYEQNCQNIGLLTSRDFGLIERIERGEEIPIGLVPTDAPPYPDAPGARLVRFPIRRCRAPLSCPSTRLPSLRYTR